MSETSSERLTYVQFTSSVDGDTQQKTITYIVLLSLDRYADWRVPVKKKDGSLSNTFLMSRINKLQGQG